MANVTPWLQFQSAQDVGLGGFDSPSIDPKDLGGGIEWSNPAAALGVDGFEASSGPVSFVFFPSQTNTLRLSNPATAGQLPAKFRLLGVEIEVRGRWEGASDGTRSVPIQAVAGSQVRAELGSCSLPLSGSLGLCVKGGPTDRMNFGPADVMASGFGFQLYGASTSFNSQGNTLFIDSLRVRFHWGEPIMPFRLRTRRRVVFTREALA